MNAFWTGCGCSIVPSPSSVVTGVCAAATAGVTHERIALLPRCTVQAPHCERPQPKRGPCRWSSLRRTYRSGVFGEACTLWRLPFTVITNRDMFPPRGDGPSAAVAERFPRDDGADQGGGCGIEQDPG